MTVIDPNSPSYVPPKQQGAPNGIDPNSPTIVRANAPPQLPTSSVTPTNAAGGESLIPGAPNFDPSMRQSLSQGNGSLISNAGGPSMTGGQLQPSASAPPAADAAAHAIGQPNAKGAGGFFARIGQAMKYLQPATAHIAAAFGNYAPLHDFEQQQQQQVENTQRQQQIANSTALSGAQTARLGAETTGLTNANNNYRTPEQIAADQLNQRHLQNIQDIKDAPGKDQVIGSSDPNNPGFIHATSTYDPDKKVETFNPAQGPNGAPVNAMTKAAGKTLEPDAQSSTGLAQVSRDGLGNEISRVRNVVDPRLASSDSSGVTTTLKDDGQGGVVPVQTPHSTHTVKTVPGMNGAPPANAAPPPTRPRIPGPDTNPNAGDAGAPKPMPGVHVGAPVLDAKASPAVVEAFKTYNTSQERYSVMQNALTPALHGDQQAQLNLLANHLGMTMGLQKGARINQSIIDEAIKSTPALAGLQAKFDDRGYLTGVALTPAQMNSMVDLAKDRVANDSQMYARTQQEARNNFGMHRRGAQPQTMPPTGATPAATHRFNPATGRIEPIQ